MTRPSTYSLAQRPDVQCTPANQALQALRHSGGKPMVHGLYLHVPFCFHKCHYCDFYSIVEPEHRLADRQAAFTDVLLKELEIRTAQFNCQPTTLFVGGGTPTLLPAEHWQTIFQKLRELDLMQQVQEFTVEANPETLTLPLAQTLAAGGVNRLSIGAQSFHPHLLKTLERWHDPANVARAVAIARQAGIEQINLDLIFAIPGQSLAMLEQDLDRALSLKPDHLSCYSLIYEPNTAMTQRLRMGAVTPIDEQLERQMYARVIDRLAAAGFEHYEISNWARRTDKGSRRCLHNLAYWTNRNWLGIGPAAASHVSGWRWKNLPHLGKYLAGNGDPPGCDLEHLDQPRQVGEQLMLQLRLLAGAALPWLDQHLPADDARWQTIEHLIDIQMLQRTDTHLKLTPQGLFVADAVIAKLL